MTKARMAVAKYAAQLYDQTLPNGQKRTLDQLATFMKISKLEARVLLALADVKIRKGVRPTRFSSLDALEKLCTKKRTKHGTCWLWPGPKDKNGYGIVTYKSKPTRIHRVAMELAGFKLAPREPAPHFCGHAHCANPEHIGQGEKQLQLIRSTARATGNLINRERQAVKRPRPVRAALEEE